MVTLTGSNLLNASTVWFDTTNAASFTVVSATQITAIAPPGTGSSPIHGDHPGGRKQPCRLLPRPALTALVPSSGPTSAGTGVTLTGTGFTGAATVAFAGSWRHRPP